MKIFVDTNVILEKFLVRESFLVANRLFKLLRQQNHELLMSAGSFYTMIFLVDKYLRKELRIFGDDRIIMLRSIMSDILQTFQVAEHDKDSLLQGIGNNHFKDIEDGCQYELAVKTRCSYLLTFNMSDFPVDAETPIKVLTPMEFIELHKATNDETETKLF